MAAVEVFSQMSLSTYAYQNENDTQICTTKKGTEITAQNEKRYQ